MGYHAYILRPTNTGDSDNWDVFVQSSRFCKALYYDDDVQHFTESAPSLHSFGYAAGPTGHRSHNLRPTNTVILTIGKSLYSRSD